MACNDDKSNVLLSDDIDETDWMFKRRKRKNAEISHSDNNKKFKLSKNETNVNSEINCGKVVENINEGTNRPNTKSRCRSKLTAENVKTILRYALANDSVLAMVQNMMKAHNANLPQPNIKIQSETARSEKKKKLRRPILTSTKKTNEISKNLFDEEYSEESASDEDYQPNEDELSDEDVTSSIKTNHVNSTVSNNSTCQDSKVEDPLSDNEDALVIALPKVFNCHDLQGVSKIAERTRSKLPLNDTPLETIEASFVPPDITKDMYDTKCVDDEWQKFLCELTKPLEPTCEIDGEDDPEYKVREEELACEPDLEEDEDFGEDSTPELNDELNVLMKEILESDQERIFLKQDFSFLEEYNLVCSEEEKKLNNSEHTELAPSCKDTPPPTEKHQTPPPKEKLQTPPPVFKTFPIKEEVREEWMILDERLQLDEQMRMHVQLATQSYLLSHGNPKLTFMCETAKTYLNELKMFSSGPTANNQQSAFYAHNLDGALDIIKKFDLKTEEDINTEKSHEYKITYLRTIPKHVRKTLATSKVFIYPELLPEHGFREILFSCYKALFCTAEDNLIAIGLEEFSYADDPLDFIRHYLLPMKKKHQIINHINLCKKEDPSKNAIAFYYKYRKPIEFKRVIRIFNPNNVKSPEEYPPENLPEWMKKYSKLAMSKKLKKELIPEKKVKFILPRIPVKIEIAKQFHVPQRPLSTLCPLKIRPPCEKAKQEIMLPKWRTRKKKLNICDKFTQLSSPPSVTPCAIPSDKDINDQNNLVPSSETNNHLDSQETVSKQKKQNESPSKKSRKRLRKSKISKRNQSHKLTKISSVLNEHLSKTDTAKVVKKVRTKKVNKHEKNSVSLSETNSHLDLQETVSNQKKQEDSTKSRKKLGNPKISKRNQSHKLNEISSVLNEPLSKTDTAKVVKKVRTKKVNKHKNSVSSSETNSHLDLQETVSKQKKQDDSTKSRKKLGNPKISKRNQSRKLNEISSVLNEPLSKANKAKVVKKTRTKKVIKHEKNSISSSETNSHLDSQETVSKKKKQNLMKNKPLTKSQKSLGKSENFKISKRNKSFKSSESSFVLNEPSLETDKIKIIKEIRTKDNKITSITNFDASQEFSSMTEPSLKIVTSQDKDDFVGDSDNEHVSTALCNNFLSTNALCEANEDAVLPPSTNSAKKKIPPDFSNIKLVINSDSKKKSIEDVDENDCPSGQKMKWSTENDMMIISNCEKYGINENAFQRSATCIHSTTTEEIKNRFIHLLKSLQKK